MPTPTTTIAGSAAGRQAPSFEALEESQRQTQDFSKINIMGGQLVTVTSAAADTEFSVAHSLKDADGAARLPVGYLIVGQDKAGVLYDGTTANTTALLYLRNSVATVAHRIWVF